ncbi:MAG: DUF4421 family protein [Prevotella sp.]|nr:DUF4421 family protein [Prevotella sp.]
MKIKTGRIIICCLLFSLNVAGQEEETTDSMSTLMEQFRQVQSYLDNKARAKVDPNYIEVPVKPWRVILRYKENMVDVDYYNTYDYPESNDYSDWQLCFQPPVASSVGFWVGYRGTGLSFSKSLAKNAGRYYSISSTGAKYGFNFRLRRFSTSDVTLHTTDYEAGKDPKDTTIESYMPAPVWIRSVYINGYYVFNGRRYSQAAAYNQSVIQRHSAGSLLAGATWYQSSLDLSDPENALLIVINRNVGRIKVHQANLGLGYGYNFVPFRGFVINAMAMPTLSVYNRVKVYKYDFNYCLPGSEEVEDNFGKWNKETRRWENGATHKPLSETDDQGEYVADQFDYWETEPETTYSALRLNLDLRLGIAYNWSNYFISLQAQYNNFHYKKDKSKVNLFDAYARVSLGVRL